MTRTIERLSQRMCVETDPDGLEKWMRETVQEVREAKRMESC